MILFTIRLVQLGDFESSVVEVVNDDEKEDIEASKARWDFSRRSPSPEVVDPPPSVEEIKRLSVRVRFAYTKPVLTAILNEAYAPVVEWHRTFLAGGQKRARLLEYSSRRGNMDPEEVNELTNYLKEWCLRPPIGNLNNQDNDVPGDVRDMVDQDEVREERLLSGNVKPDMSFGRSRSPSPPITEGVPSSPGEMPPSSFVVECEDSVLDSPPAASVVTALSVIEVGTSLTSSFPVQFYLFV